MSPGSAHLRARTLDRPSRARTHPDDPSHFDAAAVAAVAAAIFCFPSRSRPPARQQERQVDAPAIRRLQLAVATMTAFSSWRSWTGLGQTSFCEDDTDRGEPTARVQTDPW